MPVQSLLTELSRVHEPEAAQDYANMLSQVVADGKPLIIRRNGEDLAAVIPLEYLELLREVLEREEVEKQAAHIDWAFVPKPLRPPQEWFDSGSFLPVWRYDHNAYRNGDGRRFSGNIRCQCQERPF